MHALARRAAARRSASRLVNCEKTSALWPSSSELLRVAAAAGRAWRDGSSARSRSSRPGWQAACRSRSSASRTWILRLRRCPRARSSLSSTRGSGRAARRRAALLAVELAEQRLLGRGGSSGATCSFVRRRMNGRSAAQRACRVLVARRLAALPRVRTADRGRAGPGFRNSNRLHSSPRWFSIGVPVSASRCGRAAAGPPWPSRCRRS